MSVRKKDFNALIISGPVGVGKSSTADTMSEILSKQDIAHAVVDMDYLRYAYPSPKDDPFNTELGLRNLSIICKNYKAIGIKKLLIPTVVESQADIDSLANALSSSKITVVYLEGQIETIHQRLHERHGKRDKDNLDWHLNRSIEQVEQNKGIKHRDFIVDTTNKSLPEVANEVLDKWMVE